MLLVSYMIGSHSEHHSDAGEDHGDQKKCDKVKLKSKNLIFLYHDPQPKKHYCLEYHLKISLRNDLNALDIGA